MFSLKKYFNQNYTVSGLLRSSIDRYFFPLNLFRSAMNFITIWL